MDKAVIFKKNMPLISVIIPVYNVDAYLRKCLDSVQTQTYQNLEIIIVDDGSTDNSGKICDEYAQKDMRINVIHKKNGGLSEARNAGLDVFLGEYVTFIDSDDYVKKTYVERLYYLLENDRTDVSIVDFIRFYGEEEKGKSKNFDVKIYDCIEAIEDMCYQKNIMFSACAKLYRRKLFDGIRYPVGKLYEDLGTTYKLLFRSNKIVYSSEQLYCYLQRDGSIMQCGFSLRKLDRIKVGYELMLWSKNYCPELLPAAQTRFFIANMQVLREIPLERKYANEIKMIKKNIVTYRKKVIQNKDAKKVTRLIAFCSIIDMRLLKYLGKVYKKIYK